MQVFAQRVQSNGRVYLTGGACAVLFGWRDLTIDVDLKMDPEPKGAFEAIAHIKELLNMNIELAAPDDFIPPLPGWRERSHPIEVVHGPKGKVEFLHYDFYAQALSKIERGHQLDLTDVEAIWERDLIDPAKLMDYFTKIEPDLLRYPSLDPKLFRDQVKSMCCQLKE